MLNKIILMGRLTRDPELRRTESGTAVCSFSIAVDRDFKSKNGEKETDFIDIVSWRATAEFVSKYFTKGRMAVVEGRLQIRDWTDRDGGKRRNAAIDKLMDAGKQRPCEQHSEQQDDEGYTVVPDFKRLYLHHPLSWLYSVILKVTVASVLSAGRTEALPLNFTSPRFSTAP